MKVKKLTTKQDTLSLLQKQISYQQWLLNSGGQHELKRLIIQRDTILTNLKGFQTKLTAAPNRLQELLDRQISLQKEIKEDKTVEAKLQEFYKLKDKLVNLKQELKHDDTEISEAEWYAFLQELKAVNL